MRLFPCRSRWGCFWAKSRCRSSRRCKFIRVHRSIHMNTCVSAYASLHVYGAGFVHLCPLVRVELLVVFLRRGGLRQCWGFLHHSSLWRVLRHRGIYILHQHIYLYIYIYYISISNSIFYDNVGGSCIIHLFGACFGIGVLHQHI